MADENNPRPPEDSAETNRLRAERDVAADAAVDATIERDAAAAVAREQTREAETARRVAANRAAERDLAVETATVESAVASQNAFGMWLMIGIVSAIAIVGLIWAMATRPWEGERRVLHEPPTTVIVDTPAPPPADTDTTVIAPTPTPAPPAPPPTTIVTPAPAPPPTTIVTPAPAPPPAGDTGAVGAETTGTAAPDAGTAPGAPP
ncbi:MAG: hypothetical protein KY468_06415 [Armatimonadetes bacterium]|nr:hypothetical protein [Armatimonadota bacterium]